MHLDSTNLNGHYVHTRYAFVTAAESHLQTVRRNPWAPNLGDNMTRLFFVEVPKDLNNNLKLPKAGMHASP
jgi:hypothetical protein